MLIALWGPSLPTESSVPESDKLVHLLGFGGLAFVWRYARLSTLATLGIVLLMGGVTELGQAYLPWPRVPDVLDFLANTVGGVLGVGVWWLGTAVRTRQEAKSAGGTNSKGALERTP